MLEYITADEAIMKIAAFANGSGEINNEFAYWLECNFCDFIIHDHDVDYLAGELSTIAVEDYNDPADFIDLCFETIGHLIIQGIEI